MRGRGIQTAAIRTIHVVEEGNGWLYESVVARLKPSFSMVNFKEEIARKGFGDVKVRMGGGKDMVLTFNSVKDMKVKFQKMQEWLNEWCESAHEWQHGLVFEQERYVWLSCYGVPLNLWSFTTFNNIGKNLWSCYGVPLNLLWCTTEFERMQSVFLWSGSDLRRKVHMVRWEVVTKNNKLGGLGLRRIKSFNQCLLLKWWWRFGVENKSL